MRLRPLLIPALLLAAGAAVVAWLMIAEPPPPPEKFKPVAAPKVQSEERVLAALKSKALQENSKPAASKTAAPLPSEIRNVSPEGVSPPEVTDALKRIEPSKPYLDIRNPPPETLPEGQFELRRPQVLDGGTLQSGNLLVRIAYIKALAPDETCVSRLGGSWPCGARARTALRGLVRMFTLSCEKTGILGPRQIAATCNRNKVSLGEWLVRYGWADPAEDAPKPYAELAEEARAKKRGKWQAEWLKELPMTDAGTDRPEALDGPRSTISEDDILVMPSDTGQSDLDLRDGLTPPNG